MVKTFQDIPHQRPTTPILDAIETPRDMRKLERGKLTTLADEIRAYLLYCVGKTGGHFGAGLGVVELTIALHYVFNTPDDRLVWDVGHQTYPHKILTGRREEMLTMRQKGGLSGFPKRSESVFDTFGVGHSSTAMSAALGMAISASKQETDRKTAAIVGDGAMTAGMAFEAINHAAHVDANLLVILNDNQMSISRNVGGLSTYFSKLWSSKAYTQFRETGKKALSSMPGTSNFVRRTEEFMKSLVSPATIFEELGFYYVGPLDGHDLNLMVETLDNLKDVKGAILLHIITHKGRGFGPAESDPVGYHALTKIEPKQDLQSAEPPLATQKLPKYQKVFGDWLCDMAEKDEGLIAITPAMCEGSNPVVAIYSTCLQRAYDQLIHDIALQDLDVLFAIDRAGLVGEDGATHAGAFDITYLRCIPNMVVMTPSDENETRQLLYTGYRYKGPAAVRYPRGTGPGANIEKDMTEFPIGKGIVCRNGGEVAILNFGTLIGVATSVADQINATLADMRFVKPLDEELIEKLVHQHDLLVTIEENSVAGGAGAAVSEYLASTGLVTPIIHLGLPDHFADHGKHHEQLQSVGLGEANVLEAIKSRLKLLRKGSTKAS